MAYASTGRCAPAAFSLPRNQVASTTIIAIVRMTSTYSTTLVRPGCMLGGPGKRMIEVPPLGVVVPGTL